MIEILMASYNGEKYIGEQIQSIIGQSCTDWHLTICDDSSKDKTLSVAREYMSRFPDKISVVSNRKNSGGASANFFNMLMEAKNAEYVMFADQDDVWLKDKIKLTLFAMKRMEKKYGRKTPVLIHSDLTVADEKLNPLSESMFRKQKLKGTEISFAKQLCQNSVTGCTVMINGALLKYVYKKPEKAIMHDWWLALIASAFGHIGFISTPLIQYRQHGGNQEGAKDFSSMKSTLEMAGKKDKIRHSLMLTYIQAQEFRDIYRGKLNTVDKQTIDAYCEFPTAGKLKKIGSIIKYGFGKTGLNRKIGYWLYV